MVSSSLQHGKAAHTGPTSRASLPFQTDVSTLVLPSHYVKEERAVLPHTYQPNFGLHAKFATNPHALRSDVTGKTRRDARPPGGLLRVLSCLEIRSKQTKTGRLC